MTFRSNVIQAVLYHMYYNHSSNMKMEFQQNEVNKHAMTIIFAV